MAAYSLSLAIVVAGAVAAPATLASSQLLSVSIPVTCSVGAGLVLSHNQLLSASLQATCTVGAGLRLGRLYSAKALIRSSASIQAGLCTLANGATVRDAVNAIVALWGQRCGNGDSPEKAEAVGFLNAAMQRLHQSGKDFGYVGRARRFYTGYLPVSSVPLESDVQHVDGNVVFLPHQGYWFVPMALGNVNINGQAQAAANISIADGTSVSISVNDYVASRLQTATGLVCVWNSTDRGVRIYTPGGAASDNPALKSASGVALLSIEGFDWGTQSLYPPDVEFVPGVATSLRALDESASVVASRTRLASLVYPLTPTLRRPVAYGVRSRRTRSAIKDFSTGVLTTVVAAQTEERMPAVDIELVPAAEYTTGSGDYDPWELQADVFLEPPRFSCCDVDRGTRLPVPHRYAESLIIPLARYMALSARYKVQESTVVFVKEQAAAVLALLGESDPRVKEVQENRKSTAIK